MKIIKTQSKSKVKKGKSKIQNHDNLEEEEKLDFINPFSGHFTNVIKIGGQFFYLMMKEFYLYLYLRIALKIH